MATSSSLVLGLSNKLFLSLVCPSRSKVYLDYQAQKSLRAKSRTSKVRLKEMTLTKSAQSVSVNKAMLSSCLVAICVSVWIVDKAFRNQSTIFVQFAEEQSHLSFLSKDENSGNLLKETKI